MFGLHYVLKTYADDVYSGDEKLGEMDSLFRVEINHILGNFTFMLPCIVIDFFLNNQQDALIIQIYSVIKLCMFRASSLPIIRSFIQYIRHW